MRLQLDTQGIDSGDKKINELGRAGWELVSIVPTSSQGQVFTGSGAAQYIHLFFKRLIKIISEEEELQEKSNTSDEEKDHISKIERLRDLKEDGALTEEEFEEEKEELL